jgi:hypothetical protein
MLSRLLITGNIDLDTPLCIICEIADAHGINYDLEYLNNIEYAQELINTINNEDNIIGIKIPIVDINDWEYLARFVNKNASWTPEILLKAYSYLSGFTYSEEKLLDRVPTDFTGGIQTPENIYTINPCILYKICKDNKIKISHDSNLEQICKAVKFLKFDRSTLINKSIISIYQSTSNNLVNFLIFNDNDDDKDDKNTDIKENANYHYLPDIFTSYDKLRELEGRINNPREMQSLIIPRNDDSAIALAAIIYFIDISKSKYPIQEYIELKTKGFDYKPISKWLNYWFSKNPTLFDLKKTFNPLFPRGLYTDDQLIELVKHEGHSDIPHVSKLYETLQLAYISETFYLGLLPLTKTGATIVDLDELCDIPYGQLLSFGQIDVSLNPITVSELIDLFTANNNFTSPFGSNKVFTTTAINKLKNILSYPHGPIISNKIDNETLFIRKRLFDLITEIQLKNDDVKSYQFLSAYKKATISTKKSIENLLNFLLIAGMYMRAWSGKGSYPLQEAPAPYSKEISIALNVTSSIADYKRERDKLGEIGKLIDNLPLVRYRDGEYQVSTSKNDGYTIGERIEIVSKGKENPTIYSCIRMSSNWICSSAHKYSIIIGLPPPFDIFKLKHIM